MRTRSNRNCPRHTAACYSISMARRIEVSRLTQSVSTEQKSVISIFVKPNHTSSLYVAVLPTARTHVIRHRKLGALCMFTEST